MPGRKRNERFWFVEVLPWEVFAGVDFLPLVTRTSRGSLPVDLREDSFVRAIVF